MKFKYSLLGAVCALLVITSTLFASTNVSNDLYKMDTEPTWAATVGGVGFTAGRNIGTDWIWGGDLGLAKKVKLGPVNTEVGIRQAFMYGTVGYTTYSRVNTTYGSYTTVESVDAPCSAGPVDMPVTHTYASTKTISGTEKEEGWVFGTTLAWDADIKIYKGLSAMVGPFATVLYGNITPNWYIGPEAGLKYQFTEKLGVYAMGSYGWNLTDSQDLVGVRAGIIFSF